MLEVSPLLLHATQDKRGAYYVKIFCHGNMTVELSLSRSNVFVRREDMLWGLFAYP